MNLLKKTICEYRNQARSLSFLNYLKIKNSIPEGKHKMIFTENIFIKTDN